MSEPTEMELRVAKAIGEQYNGIPWEKHAPGMHDFFVGLARAAIRAMREPTDEMMEAGDKDSKVYPDGVFVSTHEGIEALARIWNAMIDAASPEEK